MAKIMIVDDDPQFLYLLGQKLDMARGYKKVVCTGGQDALDKIPKEKPDLILLDVMMPDIDGFEVCQKIKSMPGMRFTSIIFVTAKRETEDKIKGGMLGADDYITKPVDPNELLRRIRVQLRIRELQVLLSMANDEIAESKETISGHLGLLESGSPSDGEEMEESVKAMQELDKKLGKLCSKISKSITS